MNDVDFTHVLDCIFGWPDRKVRLVGSSASTLDDQPIKSYLEPKSKTRTIRPFLDLPPGRSSEFPPQIAFARPMIDREVYADMDAEVRNYIYSCCIEANFVTRIPGQPRFLEANWVRSHQN